MKKRILSLALIVAMIALMVTSFTMAYFTDTDEAVNTMVFGDAKIKLNEQQKDDQGNMVDFDADPVILVPAVFTYSDDGQSISVANKVDKYVSVTNTGKNNVYVRVIYAFEGTNAEVQDYIHAFVNDGGNWDYNPVYVSANNDFAGARMIGTEGGNWTICEAVYNIPLESGKTTDYSLKQFFLSPDADYDHTDDGVKNGIDTLFGDKYTIMVLAQAVQVEGFEAAGTKNASRVALESAFGNLWDGNDVTDQELADLFDLGLILDANGNPIPRA